MTPAQCRGASIHRLTRAELAAHAVVATTIIADYEDGVGAPRPADLEANVERLQRSIIRRFANRHNERRKVQGTPATSSSEN